MTHEDVQVIALICVLTASIFSLFPLNFGLPLEWLLKTFVTIGQIDFVPTSIAPLSNTVLLLHLPHIALLVMKMYMESSHGIFYDKQITNN